jgi:4-amino-4-deoxy-L-arabinose transferase-like glycosyltransferase
LMGGSDRALMLGLPGMAVLAAFALPTLKRSATAAIDWFSMFFFTLCAATIWVMYCAMQTGVPVKPAANIAKLAPGFEASFSWPALLLALLGSAAWVGLVRWRTGRHREALWKSMVLPAGGVALCWLLLMTLWLPLLDYGRSARPWVQLVANHIPAQACVTAPDLSPSLVASLEHFGGWRVDAQGVDTAALSCDYLVQVTRADPGLLPVPPAQAGWQLMAELRRPTEQQELTRIYRRGAR